MTTAPPAFEHFDTTAVGRWVTRLSSVTSLRRNHWRTKLIYFHAVMRLLDADPRPALTWKNIVAAAGERGCRSTFYEVAGGYARHRMVDELIKDGRDDVVQIALRYRRTEPVEQLIDETKVWSFWPYRERFLQTLTTRMTPREMEDEIVSAVTAWTIRHPALARAVGCAPPACAVEDLTVIHAGRLSGTRAADRLTEIVRQTVACL
jgi:hypothetical protein